MNYKKLSKEEYLLRLARGEEVFGELGKFCRRKKIRGGWFWAIGGLERPVLAYYDLKRKKYLERKLGGVLEVASAAGNVGTLAGAPAFHVHAVLGDKNFRAYAGHLKSGVVAATLEIYLKVFRGRVGRRRDHAVGLDLLDL